MGWTQKAYAELGQVGLGGEWFRAIWKDDADGWTGLMLYPFDWCVPRPRGDRCKELRRLTIHHLQLGREKHNVFQSLNSQLGFDLVERAPLCLCVSIE